MKRGQKIVQFNQIWVFQNAGGTKRERFISCLCNSDRTLAERGVKRVAPSLLRHPNSSEGSRVSTGIWRNHDLAANLVRWLKFLTQQCYKDVVKGGKQQCKHTHTHTHQFSSLISVLLLALLMFQPYLCKSHFAVQSQWSIALSLSLPLQLPYTFSRLLGLHLKNFRQTIICLG